MKTIISIIRRFLLNRIFRIDTWFDEHYDAIISSIRQDLQLSGDYMPVSMLKDTLGFCADDVYFIRPDVMTAPHKVYLYEDTNIYGNAKLILSPKGESGRFILMAHSGASQGLTVITGFHGYTVGKWSRDMVKSRELDVDKDVVVEEDVRIGANVTLLPGVTIGRGSIIGACSVVTKSVLPYSVVAGNPAKVLRYKFTLEQVLEHERHLYPLCERLEVEKLKHLSRI